MLNIDLAALARHEVRLVEVLASDDAVWEGDAPGLSAPVRLELVARAVGSGVWVEGTIRTETALGCRRCLVEVRRRLEASVAVLFQPRAQVAVEDAEVYPYDPGARQLDLGPAIREQLLIRLPAYVTCGDECRGLCAQCGANLNLGTCGCRPERDAGPWDELKKIRFD